MVKLGLLFDCFFFFRKVAEDRQSIEQAKKDFLEN